MSQEDICQNIKHVKRRIADTCNGCGRNPDDILLVAVSKTKPVKDIQEAMECGQTQFGENRVQEWQDKAAELGNDITWHMVGNLQTNKIKYLVKRVDWIQSIPKKKSLRELQKRASRVDRLINVLIQVNISDEDQKSGCAPEKLPALLEYARGMSHVAVRGFMGIATFTDDPEQVRPEFRLLRELKEKYSSLNGGNIQLEHLSMGMTNDMEVAIEEGATMVRVGSAIFGERNY